MLQDRILSTLKFFDLQDIPLTLFELRKFLLAEVSEIKNRINTEFEAIDSPAEGLTPRPVPMDKLLSALENDLIGQVECHDGYYCLSGRLPIIKSRLDNYFYGFRREKRIRKFLWILKYLPFVRGVAVGGSQALGQQKQSSDIDLLILTDPNFMWISRTAVTAYFQVLGVRRHGPKISDRFCLNHYIAGAMAVRQGRDLYNAMEYGRLRPLIMRGTMAEFLNANRDWLSVYFPNFEFPRLLAERQPLIQKFFERLLNNSLGRALEKVLGTWQLARIRKGEYVVATETEISFHSTARKKFFLANFFQMP